MSQLPRPRGRSLVESDSLRHPNHQPLRFQFSRQITFLPTSAMGTREPDEAGNIVYEGHDNSKLPVSQQVKEKDVGLLQLGHLLRKSWATS